MSRSNVMLQSVLPRPSVEKKDVNRMSQYEYCNYLLSRSIGDPFVDSGRYTSPY